MIYYFLDCESDTGIERHIFRRINETTVQSFYDDSSNTSSEREHYLAWVEEGNVPEEWNPEAPQ